jgi:hypothetical protein
LFSLVLDLVKVIISVSLNNSNTKGVGISRVDTNKVNIKGISIVGVSSLGVIFNNFFFLISNLISLCSF